MSDLQLLFRPRSVALIGASTDTKKYGYWTAKSLIDNQFDGDLYMVSRTKADSILGYRPYTSVLDIEASVDLAVVAIAPRYIQDVIAECTRKGVRCAIIVSTGFGETGPAGKKIEQEILHTVRANNMRVMGPNCMGMYSSCVNLNTSIIDLDPGPLSLVLQSGNFGIDINVHAKARKMGYSCWATIGNQVDLRFHDFVNYIKDDDATKALLLYMEGLRVESEADGRKFIDVARETSRTIPIVAIKIGRSAAGTRAATSHTGSLAGSEAVFDAALRQAGIIRVDSSSELLDMAEAFVKCAPARGNRMAILTDGGGHGVMATDVAERFGLAIPVLSESTQEKLRNILMPHCPVRNPVDLAGTPEADMWVFDQCAEVLLADPDVDGLIIVGLYGGYADISEEFRVLEMDVAQSLVKRIKAFGKPVTMHSIYQYRNPACLEYISDGGVPVYYTIESAVHAMGCLVTYEQRKKDLESAGSSTALTLPEDRKDKANRILSRVRESNRINLVETEARDMLKAYGFDLPAYDLVKSAHEAAACLKSMGTPVAMKIVSPDILHKTDAGGVQLDIHTEVEARDAFDRLIATGRKYRSDAEIYGVMITPMLPTGVECIIGSTWDITFGPTVMFGLGGIFVEVLNDVSFRVAPLKLPEAHQMLTEIKGGALLEGIRGANPVDREALAEAICRISQMVAELKEVAEVDLNPVLAMEKGLAIVDARVVLHPEKL